jgi:hypothetical protein
MSVTIPPMQSVLLNASEQAHMAVQVVNQSKTAGGQPVITVTERVAEWEGGGDLTMNSAQLTIASL